MEHTNCNSSNNKNSITALNVKAFVNFVGTGASFKVISKYRTVCKTANLEL
jgi:hypothetical protein